MKESLLSDFLSDKDYFYYRSRNVSPEEQKRILRENPDLLKVWDAEYGDRIIRLVFIGQHMDKKKIIAAMDNCLGV